MSVGASDLLLEPQFGLDAGVEGEGETIAARSPWQIFWGRFRADRVAMVSLAFIGVLLAAAILAPLIIDLVGAAGPTAQNPGALDQFGTPSGPSFAHHHFFGVDPLGRDVFSRVLYGARVSFEVAFIATGISLLVGVTMGMIAGFYRGWVDAVLARVMDVLLAFPIYFFAIGLASACALGHGCLGGLVKPGLTTVIIVISVANWPYIARLIRGQVLSLREKEFIDAARSLGASNRRIIFREVLPNLVAPIIVYGSLVIPQNILFEAALSFLGLGVQPPQASWGQMLADASGIFDTAWWYMVFPGVALVFTVLAFNLVGDGLNDALNPKLSKSK
jgi:ABC-type dipeptide/oligopeptide/nickel transport system permease subunit